MPSDAAKVWVCEEPVAVSPRNEIVREDSSAAKE